MARTVAPANALKPRAAQILVHPPGYLPFSGRALISQGTGLNTVYFADSGSNAVFNLTGTLQTGTYRFAYFSGAIGPQNGTLFNLSFTAVPAPGAVALEALRESLRRRSCKPAQIDRYASLCGVATVVRPYLEAIA